MGQLRVVSYNVRYFGHATRGLASTRGGMDRIARAIASLTPLADVVCLQEVETSSLRSTLAHRGGETQIDRLMGALGRALDGVGHGRGIVPHYTAHYFPAHTYRVGGLKPLYTTGLAVLVRDDLTVLRHNALEPRDITHRRETALKPLKQTRICAHVRVETRERAIVDVFNTHLSLPSTFSRSFWTEKKRLGWGPNQLEEAKALAAFVEHERASDRYLVVGDFNSMPGSPVYRHLLDQARLTDAFASHGGHDEDTLFRQHATAGFMNLRMRLDHVFSGPGLRWLDFESTAPFAAPTSPFTGLSDHVPIIGTFVTT